MYNVLMAFVFACPAVSVADRVPDKAELRAILREASSDIYAKRYDAAFDKHLWFHRNMSTIERALDGPPLAYWHELRLANWRKLAENHPPVVSKLKQIRADAQRDVLKGTDGGESFLLMAEINQTLGEGYHTIATLIDLGERDPKACKQLFGHARPYILRTEHIPSMRSMLTRMPSLRG